MINYINIDIRKNNIMKRLFTFAFVAFAAFGAMNAEIVEGYNAPTKFQAYNSDENIIFWFEAPAEGGVVWASNFSYATGLGDMRSLGDGDGWANAGGGAEISTAAAVGTPFTNHASTLATPAVSLATGQNYELNYRSAGSRSSNNQQLSVVLYRGDAAVATLVEAYELAPSLNYESKSAVFSVDESADDYEVRFVFTESEKNCGASLMGIVLAAPVPEDRGALLGYNLYCNDVLTHYYKADEAVQNNLYKQLTADNSELEYSTTYTYALQAVYEGGESPLSNSASFTTREDPMVGIKQVKEEGSSVRYDLIGRRTNASSIVIEKGKKSIK